MSLSCGTRCCSRPLPEQRGRCSRNRKRRCCSLQSSLTQAKASIQPELDFYQQKFGVQFHDTVRAFKAARLCCPVQVQVLRITAATLEEFWNFPFPNNDATIANLARKLPQYMAAAAGVTVSCDDDNVS